MADEELRQKCLQFQMWQQQIEQISEHVQLLNQQTRRLNNSVETVKEIKKTKVDNKNFTPITNEIFLKAELKDNQKLIINVGADTTIEKKVDEVVRLLEEQRTCRI